MGVIERLEVFDPLAWTLGLSSDTLKNLRYFGTHTLLTATFPVRTFHTASEVITHLREIRDGEVARLRTLGFQSRAILGVSPDMRPKRSHFELWSLLDEEVQSHPEVAAIGSLSIHEDTPDALDAFDAQVRIALSHSLPVILAAPQERPVARVYQMYERARTLGVERVLVLGAPPDTRSTLLEEGAYLALTVGPAGVAPRKVASLWRWLCDTCPPHTLSRVMLTSAARAGLADVLATTKALHFLWEAGVESQALDRLSRENASALFGM